VSCPCELSAQTDPPQDDNVPGRSCLTGQDEPGDLNWPSTTLLGAVNRNAEVSTFAECDVGLKW
jgi:hypothetical protein